MYVIEITENKIDNLMQHITSSMKCLSKVAECLEDMKGDGYEYDDEDDYEPRREYKYGGQSSRSEGMTPRRGRMSGRYSRY